MQHIPVYTSILITLKSYFSVWTYGSIAICTNILYMYCDIFWGWLDNNKTKAFAHPMLVWSFGAFQSGRQTCRFLLSRIKSCFLSGYKGPNCIVIALKI